jgi:hypothetical protein
MMMEELQKGVLASFIGVGERRKNKLVLTFHPRYAVDHASDYY